MQQLGCRLVWRGALPPPTVVNEMCSNGLGVAKSSPGPGHHRGSMPGQPGTLSASTSLCDELGHGFLFV